MIKEWKKIMLVLLGLLLTISQAQTNEEKVIEPTTYSNQATNRTHSIKTIDCNRGRLVNGTLRVEFEGDFRRRIKSIKDVIITLTPNGDCRGLHITEIDKDGFSVSENNGGSSNIEFMWIAIIKYPDQTEETYLAPGVSEKPAK